MMTNTQTKQAAIVSGSTPLLEVRHSFLWGCTRDCGCEARHEFAVGIAWATLPGATRALEAVAAKALFALEEAAGALCALEEAAAVPVLTTFATHVLLGAAAVAAIPEIQSQLFRQNDSALGDLCNLSEGRHGATNNANASRHRSTRRKELLRLHAASCPGRVLSSQDALDAYALPAVARRSVKCCQLLHLSSRVLQALPPACSVGLASKRSSRNPLS